MPQIAMSFLPSLICCSLLLASACLGLELRLMHSSCNAPSSTSPNCLVQSIACVQFMTSRNLMFHTLRCMYQFYSMESPINTIRLQLMWGSLTLARSTTHGFTLPSLLCIICLHSKKFKRSLPLTYSKCAVIACLY